MIRHNILINTRAAAQFIEGVVRLKDPAVSPWPGQAGLSIYDFFVFWHHRAMMLSTPPGQRDRNAAHSGPSFLPWHRYMLMMLEWFLRDTLGDDDFRLPYWDWGADSLLANPAGSAVWGADLLGRFEHPSWSVRLEPNPIADNPRVTDRPLNRALGGGLGLPTTSQVREIVHGQAVYDQPFYDRFTTGLRNHLEGWIGAGRLHNAVHVWVGGDMVISTSPNDPAFFLHHCNVDRIWAAWQQRHPNAEYLPSQSESNELRFHRIDDPMHTFFDHEVTVRQMLDTGPLYTYDTVDDLL